MDFRELQQFVTLAETLHFGRASERCHISPSTLSRSIARLEEELGVELFQRNNRKVSLTDTGRYLLEQSRRTLAEWDGVRSTLMLRAGELHGEISMYCSVTASYSFLFEILERFRRDHPKVEIKLHTGDPEDAIPRVIAGLEDVAIGARPDVSPAGLDFRPTAVSPLLFIVATEALDDLLPGGGSAGRDAWSRCPMILPERGLARQRADAWFLRKGIEPKVYAQVAGNEAIVSMVSLGFGVGLVPKIVLDNSPLAHSVEALEVSPQMKPYEVGLFTQSEKLSNPIIRAFWSQLGNA